MFDHQLIVFPLICSKQVRQMIFRQLIKTARLSSNQNVQEIRTDKNVTLADDKSSSERKGNEKLVSQNMLVDQLIKENKIHWVPSMKTFLVEGIKGSKRVVTITPKETCSCPSTGQCYHILAVKTAFNLSTGINKNSKPVKNLSMLIKK